MSIHTVSRTLKRRNWSRKVARKEAAERDDILRAAWRARAATWPVDKLVFVDESASNERTGWRKYGWNLVGYEARDIQIARRSERWSILPAITVTGYLEGTAVYQGSIDGEFFDDWIENTVLPQLEGTGWVIVMDNASIHRSQRLHQVIGNAGHYLEKLPPYSPDYNPIEESFATLKAWIKRHRAEASLFDDFGAFLHYAVSRAGGTSARAQFRHAGYE